MQQEKASHFVENVFFFPNQVTILIHSKALQYIKKLRQEIEE